MVDQQPRLTFPAVEAGRRKVRLAHDGSRHRQGVDEVGLLP